MHKHIKNYVGVQKGGLANAQNGIGVRLCWESYKAQMHRIRKSNFDVKQIAREEFNDKIKSF